MSGNCKHITELISDYIDGNLKPSDHARVSEHLDSCSECKCKAEEIRLLASSLRTLSEDKAPFDMWPAISTRIEMQPKKLGLFGWIAAATTWKTVAVPTAAAAALIMITVFTGHHNSAVRPAVQLSKAPKVSDECSAYLEAYSSFRSAQALTDKAAVSAAGQLQRQKVTPH